MTVNMSFFGGNPFATPVGQRIEQATDASLASENWALNMEVCDIVNDTEEGPKDAIKAIRKRLQQNAGKNYAVFMYTLTVLETCVKNCGMRFRVLACNKEFILELTRLIGPKYDPPRAVQDKVLSLIQSWSDAFSHLPDLAGVTQVYHDLRQKGIEFPMTDLDAMAPIHTPQRSVPEPDISIDRPTEAANLAAATGAVLPGAGVVQSPAPHAQVQPKPAAVTPGSPTSSSATLSPEQLAKLRSELEVVQGNAAVLNEMLAEVEPGKEHPSDLQLLQELYSTCRAMQTRLVDLIGKVAHDELTADLLRINDQLNNLFLRYGRFVKNREAGNQAAAAMRQEANKEADESLIDLSEEAAATPLPAAAGGLGSKLAGLSINSNNVTSQLSRISSVPAQHGSQQRVGAEGGAEGGGARGGAAMGGTADDTEFDMFAQSRNVTYESSKAGGSTYKDNLDPDQTTASLGSVAQTRSQPITRESDFREMEAWLQDRPDVAEESLTSSEFERFLAERAAAAEALPTVPASLTAVGGGVAGNTSSSSSGMQGARRRQKEGGEDEAASLFAL